VNSNTLAKIVIFIAICIALSLIPQIFHLTVVEGIGVVGAIAGVGIGFYQTYLDYNSNKKSDEERLRDWVESEVQQIKLDLCDRIDSQQQTINYLLEELKELTVSINTVGRIQTNQNNEISKVRDGVAENRAAHLVSSRYSEMLLRIQLLEQALGGGFPEKLISEE
jgi:hypothetical protein